MPVRANAMWPEEVDEVIGGDLTCAVANVTPAGGAVVTAVAPIGLRDREAGTVGFTTSLGFGRKLERIREEPRIALAYHAREHGLGDAANERYVLVQGVATFEPHPDRDFLQNEIGPRSARFIGAPRRGVFWDRWLGAYYADRVLVTVKVERILVWPDLRASGAPQVVGAVAPDGPPQPQAPPNKGIGPRVDAVRAGRRVADLPHRLLAYVGADGFPLIVPFDLAGQDAGGLSLETAAALPAGGRRAGLVAHRYNAKLIGLETRQHTGWLEVSGDGARYAPHTEGGFKAPANKTLLLLGNGYLARKNLEKARKGGRVAALSR
jgi:hypothetical protein